MATPRLLARLLVAAGGLGACSRTSPTIHPDPEQHATPPGTPSASPGTPGAMRKPETNDASGAAGTSGASASPGVGPSERCRGGLACVPGSWCGYPTSTQPGFFGPPSERCRCGDAGRFVCPAPRPADGHTEGLGEVCLPVQGDCLPQGPAATEALQERHRVSCPVLSVEAGKGPTKKKNSEGVEECCYQVRFHLCEGRPLVLAGQQRKAPLHGGATWI